MRRPIRRAADLVGVTQLAQKSQVHCEFVEALVDACCLAIEADRREVEERIAAHVKPTLPETTLVTMLLNCIDHFRIAIGNDLQAIEVEMLSVRDDRDQSTSDRQLGDGA